MAYADDLLKSLEDRGPDAVRLALARGEFGAPLNPINAQVKEWLALKDLASVEEREARRDTNEAINSSIAHKALAISERANKIAISAIIFSVATAIAITVIQFIYAKP